MTTLADEGLRVRSEPRIGRDSFPYEPLLPLGTQLYVLGGPVSASGYAWYGARWVALSCDPTPYPGSFEPGWFNGLAALVEPAQTGATGATGCDSFRLIVDVAGEYPLREQENEVIEVTGIFDHPAARACTWTNWDPINQKDDEPAPSHECRLQFAVTDLVVVRP